MRSIFVLLILVMIGLNGKGQSVTALPDSVLSQCCLEVTLLNGNVTTVDWVFIQYITRDGTGTKLFVEYAPNFGGIQWETQIRIQDDFDDVLERSKFIVIPFTVGSTDYGINRNWIANIEENTTTGGTWIYGRFGTPTKRKFSAVEDYETMKNLLLACRPRAILIAENGLYTEGDTVRMGGFLIEPTRIQLEGYPITFIDTMANQSFGIGEGNVSGYFGDTIGYFSRRVGKFRQMITQGNRYNQIIIRDTTNSLGDYAEFYQGLYTGNKPYMFLDATNSEVDGKFSRVSIDFDSVYLENRPYLSSVDAYTRYSVAKSGKSSIGVREGELLITGSGVELGAYGYGIGSGASEYLFMKTKAVDNGTASVGQYLKLLNTSTGEVDFATIDLSAYLPIADTAAMLDPYIQGAGTLNYLPKFTAGRVIGNSNLFDNNTYAGVIAIPWKFGEYTTPGLPTGATGYTVYNTTTNGLAWYQGSRWAYGLESTANRFTAGSVIFADANGQATQDNANLFWNNSNKRLGIGTTSPSQALEIYTSNTGNIDLFKIQTATSSIANIKFTMNSFEGTISSHLFKLASTQGTAPILYLANNEITARFTTSSGSNNINLRANTVILGNFGFFFTSNTERRHYALQQDLNYLGGFDAGINLATYDHRTNSTLNKGEVLFKLAPSKEVWVGDGVVDNNYNLYITQPSLGYGSISTTSGIATITGTGRNTLFTKDFNVGTAIVINATTFTVTGITNDYTATVSPTPGFTGTYAYTINNTSPTRLGVYKNGGVVVNGATGQTRNLLDVKNQSGATFMEVNKDGDFTVKKSASPDSVTLNKAGVLIDAKGTSGSFDSKFEVYDYGYIDQTLSISTQDDPRYNFNRSRGTIATPTALLKDDKIGGIYFNAHNGSSYRKAGYIGAIIDSIYSSARPRARLIFGTSQNNSPETSSYWRFLIEQHRNISVLDHVTGANVGIGFGSNITLLESMAIEARFHVKGTGTTTSKTMLLEDSGGADILTIRDNKLIQAHGYGTSATTAAALSKTLTNYGVGFATDGTVTSREIKRDTTIYVVDADYNFSTALTTAQVAARYNRVIFLMTTTAAAGSDSELTLHAPDINLMQCEYLVRSTDEAGGFANVIRFGSNNAVDSTNGLASSYFPAAGQGVGIRAGLRSGVYKYFYY